MTIRIKPVARPEASPAVVLKAVDRPLSGDVLAIRRRQGMIEAAFGVCPTVISDSDKAVRSPWLSIRRPTDLASRRRSFPIPYLRITNKTPTLLSGTSRPSVRQALHHETTARQARAPELGVPA